MAFDLIPGNTFWFKLLPWFETVTDPLDFASRYYYKMKRLGCAYIQQIFIELLLHAMPGVNC